MDGLGAGERRERGRGKKKGFEKEGGVGGERMPTTPPLQCCDTRALVPPRERDGAEGRREREKGSCMGNGKKIRRRSKDQVGPQDGTNNFSKMTDVLLIGIS